MRLLHIFSVDDGQGPNGLIFANGALYGTAASAGGTNGGGSGTVFRLGTGGAYQVLHVFGQQHDGQQPYAGLIEANGTFYGTTVAGGACSCAGHGGIVFSVSKAGTERILHKFKGGDDGAWPFAGLIYADGILYGTTSEGGAKGDGTGACTWRCGTVFSVSTTGVEHVLHAFTGGADGAGPMASLVEFNGKLYGTTEYGGTSGYGTIFSVSKTGSERVLYSFGYGTDGAYPVSDLIVVNGALYGTTSSGGSQGCGTVFEVSIAGSERVLYHFKCGSDGRNPQAGLTAVNNVLYGTTQQGGGDTSCPGSEGCGTIFRVSTTGAEQVLFRFSQGTFGTFPVSRLIESPPHGSGGPTFYGTAGGGGPNQDIGGTVFAFTPP